jgi:hypothetical protein
MDPVTKAVATKNSEIFVRNELFEDKSVCLGKKLDTAHNGAGFKGEKQASIFVANNYLRLIEETGTYAQLLTCNITCQECSPPMSWILIQQKREELINLLKTNYPQLLFIVSGIEEFTGKQGTKKKKSGGVSEDPEDIESLTDNISESSEETDKNGPFLYEVPDEVIKSQLLYFFSENDENLKPNKAASIVEIIQRITKYLLHFEGYTTEEWLKYFAGISSYKEKGIDILDFKIYKFIYEDITAKYGFIPVDTSSQKGYAHIHMGLFFTTKDGKKIATTEITNLILKSRLFIDVDNQEFLLPKNSKTSKPEDLVKSTPIGYCWKNTRHRPPFIKLGFTNPCALHNITQNSIVDTFFYNLINFPNVHLIVDGIKAPQTQKLELVKTPSPKASLEPKQTVIGARDGNHDEDFIPAAENKLEQMIAFVNNFLKNNDYALSGDGYIYKKVQGSKFTYKPYYVRSSGDRHIPCDYKLIMADFTSTTEGRKFFPKMKEDYFSLASLPNQKVFRRILINWEWMEFKDFFIHVPTKKIIREQNEWPSYIFFPSLSLEDLNKIKNGELKPDKWLEILQNSGYVDSDGKPVILTGTFTRETNGFFQNFDYAVNGQYLINDLYRLLYHKVHKAKVPVLIGPPDCGKTTLVSIFAKILPPEAVGTCSASNGFEMSSFDGKVLVMIDEMTLKSTGLNRSSLLQTLEGNALVNINAKHKDPVTKVLNTNMVLMSNSSKWAQASPDSQYPSTFVAQMGAELDSAYVSRCNFYILKSLENKDINVKSYIERKEKGLIFLYLLAYSEKDIEIIDDMDELREIIDEFIDQKLVGLICCDEL